MALNGISTEVSGDGSDPVATKILRREDKLALAAAKRSSTATYGYRSLNTLSGTHSAYVNGAGGPTLETLSGSVSPTDGHPWSIISGSLVFTGANYLSVTGGVGTAMGTGDFTWETWVYPTSSTGYQAFIDSRTNPLAGGDTTGFYFGTNINTLTPMYYTDSLQLASSVDMTLNAWNHVALTRNSGTVTLWVNGASGGTKSDTTNLTEQRVFVGSSGLDLYLTGSISNLRIVKGTAVYTEPFTPPTAPLPTITGTQLLLNTTYNANFLKDSSTNNFTVTNNSSVSSSSANPFSS